MPREIRFACARHWPIECLTRASVQARNNLLITGKAPRSDLAAIACGLQCAVGFALVPAVAKLALAQKGRELAKTCSHFLSRNVMQPELTHSRRIDQLAAAGEMEELCRCGGVAAFIGGL